MKEPDWDIVGQIVVAVLVALVNEWRRHHVTKKKRLTRRPRMPK